MVTERSSTAFDTIRIRGKWWIPDGSEQPRTVPGELTFEVRAGGTLELDDALSDKLQEIPVIHGQGTKGECITIFNGFSDGLQINANSMGVFRLERILFFDMWVGNQWFDSKTDVRFVSYSFGMHNIENWADRRCFSIPNPHETKQVSISYIPPDAIPLFTDNRLSIVLDSCHSGPAMAMGQLESSIQHYPRIVIRSKEGLLPYYGTEGSISEREWMIFVLIALLMGNVTWKFGFKGIVRPLKIEEAGYIPEISVRHYFQHDWGKTDASKHPICFELLFPYDTFEGQLPTISSRFAEIFRLNENPIDILYRLQCRKGTFYSSTLPELLFAFEELEKNLFCDLNNPIGNKEQERIKALREKLAPHCLKNEKDLLFRKLTFQGLSYAQRFRIAFQEMKAIYPELGTDLAKPLIDYFRGTRNDYAHAAKSTSNDHARYVFASHWMAEFMTLMVLRACGLSNDKIKQVFFRNPGPDRGKAQRFFSLFRED